MAREISSPTGVVLTIPLPLPFCFPVPFPFTFPSSVAIPSPSHPLVPSLSRSLSHRPGCPPHPCHHHCHCHREDGSFHCSALRDRPVLIVIILLDYLIPLQWSNGQEVAWFVLPAAWQLNLCPGIITTVPRKTLSSAFNLPRAGCLRIGAINLIPEGMRVFPPPMVHLVAGFVKHLPHRGAGGTPPGPKRRTPAPAVRPHQLES